MLNPKAGHIVYVFQCQCGSTFWISEKASGPAKVLSYFTRITEKTARNDLPDCPLRRCIHDLPRVQANAATPIGGGFGRIFRVGDQPVSANIAGYYNVAHPTGTPNWQLRAELSLLFPER
jgi:hypothetical protein